jgi:hypothetical protein
VVLAFRASQAALNSVFAARLRAPETAERLAKSACLRLFTLIQGHPNWHSRRALRVDRVKPLLLEAKRSFRMGVAGWRFAQRNLSGRAAVIAVLEDWLAICSVVVAVGSMIMIGIMLYNDWQQ